MLGQSWLITLPGRAIYKFWQPWVKGYHGEQMAGYANRYDFPIYIWIDQDLKEEMDGEKIGRGTRGRHHNKCGLLKLVLHVSLFLTFPKC